LHQSEISSVHLVLAPWQKDFVRAAGLDSEPRLQIHLPDMQPSSVSRNLWHYYDLPSLASEVKADIVHLSYPVPVNRSSFACPIVVTLHDLYPYEIPLNFGFPQVIFNRLILRQCLRNADAIACVSEITRQRLRQYLNHTWNKATTIYNCVESSPLQATVSPIPGWRNEPFLLSIAQHRRNKNIPLLVRTFDRLLRFGQIPGDTQLVVVGITGPETPKIHGLVSEFGLDKQVHFLEGLSEPELQWCYAQCEALVAPSITEGFGLPVAEALLVACRVVCSDIPAFREVGGKHCRFVSLDNNPEEMLAEGIVAALHEPTKEPVELPLFSEGRLAEQYVNLYRNLLSIGTSLESTSYSTTMATASERQSS
jgi:glycosyltransferase involved in cell wall biosynthesis